VNVSVSVMPSVRTHTQISINLFSNGPRRGDIQLEMIWIFVKSSHGKAVARKSRYYVTDAHRARLRRLTTRSRNFILGTNKSTKQDRRQAWWWCRWAESSWNCEWLIKSVIVYFQLIIIRHSSTMPKPREIKLAWAWTWSWTSLAVSHRERQHMLTLTLTLILFLQPKNHCHVWQHSQTMSL
jgi:hypothetical protein